MERMQIPRTDPRHQTLVKLVTDCHRLSKKYMEGRYSSWTKAEKMDAAFIDVTETDEKGRKMNPFERQIYIPVSRACKDVILTYWIDVFAGQRPIMKLHPRGPEDVKPAKLHEIVLDYQNERQRLILCLYQWLNDILRYGMGDIKNVFGRDYTTAFVTVPTIVPYPVPHVVNKRVEKRVMAYEGPKYSNTDPRKFFPDPRVPTAKVQDGQFVGYEYGRSYYYLKQMAEKGVYYNVEYLKAESPGSEYPGVYPAEDEDRHDTTGAGSNADAREMSLDENNPWFKIWEFYIELVPADYELTESTRPEIWIFTVANERVLIRSERMINAHGRFPCVVGQYDYDRNNLFSQGFYESVQGMQDLLNWMYNSHIENVRRFLNDTLVVDPTAVNIRDITKPMAAKGAVAQECLH
ncbi:MAG: hypothetical protein JRJ78_13900 [Deltaproteobacteria bacterium]|nr:hypothetical protein [Deltaproteobacteria bacterium]